MYPNKVKFWKVIQSGMKIATRMLFQSANSSFKCSLILDLQLVLLLSVGDFILGKCCTLAVSVWLCHQLFIYYNSLFFSFITLVHIYSVDPC